MCCGVLCYDFHGMLIVSLLIHDKRGRRYGRYGEWLRFEESKSDFLSGTYMVMT